MMIIYLTDNEDDKSVSLKLSHFFVFFILIIYF
jgi:hypothetical protein